MTTLQDIIPQVFIPYVPVIRLPRSAPATAGYAPVESPPLHHIPYWILHDPTLADSMMERLRTYLSTARGRDMHPSRSLQTRLDDLRGDLLDTPAGELRSEATTRELWDYCLFPLIRLAVQEVDQNPTRPTTVTSNALYSQIPDSLICPTSASSPRLHREDKSWLVFDEFAPKILALAGRIEDGQLGTSLELEINEVGERSIIMKMGVSMIGGQNLVPYGLLFGGARFMLFSLFRNADTLGEVRYGLACSDIIDCTSILTPLLPLVVYTLLGNTNDPAQLCHPTFTIPPVVAPVIQDSKAVTQSKFKKFVSSVITRKAIILTQTPSGAISRSFLLYREPDASESPSPMRFISTLFNALLAPFGQIEISFTECIGHGASGQVFVGTADDSDEKYAIKIAPWKNGKPMLRREADIYNILSDLQGQCIPKIYGFFGSEHLKALIMTYMGRSVDNISDLSVDQRHQLLEELYLIHEHGVLHGDLRASNIVLQNGSAHFIDFSHGSEHQCTGRGTCFELIKARQFLLLDPEHLSQTGQQ